MQSRLRSALLIFVVFVTAFGARFGLAQLMPSIHHPDEIFQALEQAHWIVYGYGVVPWEFLYGTRSWLLPGALIGPMWIARWFGGGPEIYLPLTTAMLSLLGALSVVCAFLWSRRFFGTSMALLATLLPAFAIDPVYFSSRPLTEAIAAHVLVIALYLSHPGYEVSSRARLFAAGLLFGLVVVVRLQLAPAVLVAVLWSPLNTWRARIPFLILGGAVTVALSGLLDYFTWGAPFLSAWRNFSFNLLYGVSSSFGEQPWSAYIGYMLAFAGGGAAVTLLLALIGAPRMPLLLALALVILGAHTLIAHKEFRFIYPAILLATILAGFGLVRVTAFLSELARERWSGSRFAKGDRIKLAAMTFALVFVSGQFAARIVVFDPGPSLMRTMEMVQASAFVAKLPSVCGIGTYGMRWWRTGGYTHFHHNVPYYWLDDEEELTRYAAAYNTLVFVPPLPRALDWKVTRCINNPAWRQDRLCIAQRPGPCQPLPMRPTPVPEPLKDVEPLVKR